MIDPEWLKTYPPLQILDEDAADVFTGAAAVVSAPAGQQIFGPGDPCDHWFILLKGSVRVIQTSTSGREIVICRFFPGKTCIITALGAMAGDPHTTAAFADTDVTAIALPTPTFRKLIGMSDRFREFVFSAYNTEILSLMALVEDVACGRIDSRLATCLLTRKAADGSFHGTHEDLAVELGTAREVVSRQLKTFEQRGWVKTMRGQIALQNPVALRQISTHQV